MSVSNIGGKKVFPVISVLMIQRRGVGFSACLAPVVKVGVISSKLIKRQAKNWKSAMFFKLQLSITLLVFFSE